MAGYGQGKCYNLPNKKGDNNILFFKETTLFQLAVFRLTWGESPGQDTAFPLPLLFVCEEEEKERRGGAGNWTEEEEVV